MTRIPIYLVSLPRDSQRRVSLEARFPDHYGGFIKIDAVDGGGLPARVYYKTLASGIRASGEMMSPSEVGCALSHVNALRAFVRTQHERALVIEDDVLGSDREIYEVMKISRLLPDGAMMLCGAQEGLSTRKYQYGKALGPHGLYEVCKASQRYMFGTYAYVVTKSSAEAILRMQERNLSVADRWEAFFQSASGKVYYVNLLGHPPGAAGSHIESERCSLRSRTGLASAVFTPKIFKNAFLSMRRRVLLGLCRLRGFRRIE